MNTLSGKWMIVHAEMNGQDVTAAFANQTLEIDDGAYNLWLGDAVTDSGQLTFYEGSALDIQGLDGPNKGKMFACIHKLENGRLVICYNLAPGGVRPTEYSATVENKFVLITYKKK